ncbi:MAG: hypothetical protein AAFO95_01520 [Cyanobacteria bacterium J06600_6]
MNHLPRRAARISPPLRGRLAASLPPRQRERYAPVATFTRPAIAKSDTARSWGFPRRAEGSDRRRGHFVSRFPSETLMRSIARLGRFASAATASRSDRSLIKNNPQSDLNLPKSQESVISEQIADVVNQAAINQDAVRSDVATPIPKNSEELTFNQKLGGFIILLILLLLLNAIF